MSEVQKSPVKETVEESMKSATTTPIKQEATKHVIIIGAGIAGLTAGIYARQSGFAATILESHTIPGGASTSWRRKGYLFEGGMHWLTGSSPKKALNAIWREVGALNEDTQIFNHDPFCICEFEGKTISLYRDLEKLQRHLIALSPEDKREIIKVCKDIKRFAEVEIPISNLKDVKMHKKPLSTGLSTLISLPAFMRMPAYAKLTVGEFAQRFKSPAIRRFVTELTGEEMNAVGFVFTMATLASGDGGYPEGGSLAMAKRMATKFETLGGEIRYSTHAERVVVAEGQAVGVRIDGNLEKADAVIVTQDTIEAADALFDPPFSEPWVKELREECLPLLNTFVSLGVHADLSDIPEMIAFSCADPINCAGQNYANIRVNNYAAYAGYAPDGCTALTVFLAGDSYDWWKQQQQEGTYAEEKQKLAEAVIAQISEKFPQIKDKVEVWDVATPLTYERYIHSYKGSWMSNLAKGGTAKGYPLKSQSIDNLYFAGQRLRAPGGLPVAVESGRSAVQYLCRDTDAVFQGELG